MEMPIIEEEVAQLAEEDTVQEMVEDVVDEEPVMEMPIIEEPADQPVEETPVAIQTKEDENLENIADEVQKELIGLSIDIDDDEIPEAIAAPPPLTEDEVKQNLDPSDLFKANEPEEDATALTEADLDMIESLEEEKKNPTEESEPVDEALEDSQTEEEEEEEETQEEEIVPEAESVNDEEIIEEVMEEQAETPAAPPAKEEKESETKVEDAKQEERKPSITEQILMEDAKRIAEEEANKPDPVEEQIEKPADKKHQSEKLETKTSQTPIVPVYSAEIPDEDIVESDNIQQGDRIIHAEFGRGVVEKIINYGERKLCSVNFEQVGRRLLDPKISEMKKV